MDFEKLGSFYLGKEFDIDGARLLDRLLMYDARDLTTHAVCVGMTGSGKTGLCVDLLEEAAIDRVPALIIDPKGDMTNLLLNFPDLQGSDFRPWVNVDDARRKGLSVEEFAEQQAALWKKGLGEWGQDAERIRLVRESADFTIYTPGSDAGKQVSILQSFSAPPLNWDDEAELLRERIQGVVSGLLGLVGVDADPIKSREHILMSNLFEHFWRRGEDMDIAKLILSIQNPPIRRLGVFDVDTFFPQKDRFELSMSLNSIVAAPAFQGWIEGESMDVSRFLATSEGKPRHSIFYIAHLSDSERMFFVTMLLNQVISWMRTQSGTTSLRAILYMDEIFGFFPPVANPPSKRPMLTLLKQARAFGLGVVLATQNPIDLDYKGLTNAGTWFIGRLQTERDKVRVLEGLEGVSSSSGQRIDRDELSRLISDLGKRVFLLHNVHEGGPVAFQTRWALSYLRGPMTRSQIRKLVEPEESTASEAGAAKPPAQPKPAQTAAAALSSVPPTLPAGVATFYLPARREFNAALAELEEREGRRIEADQKSLVYRALLLGAGRVHFVNSLLGVEENEEFALLAEPPERSAALRWEDAESWEGRPRDLLDRPYEEAHFDQVPESVNETNDLKRMEKDLSDFLYRNKSLPLFYNPALKIHSRPGETRRDFSLRISQQMREQRDEEVDKLSASFEKKIDKLRDRLRRAELAHEKKEETAAARTRETFLAVGESILGMFMGRRSTRIASSGLSKYRMSSTAKMAAREAEEKVEIIKRDIEELEEELRRETESISERWEQAAADLEEKPVTPRRRDVNVELFGVAWAPHWRIEYDRRTEVLGVY